MIDLRLLNKSTVITDPQCQLMVQACNALLPAFCRAWNVMVPTFTFQPKNSNLRIPPNSWVFWMIDDSPVEDALAYHTEENDSPDGYIAAKTCLNNGCAILYKDDKTDTIAATLCHEIFEMLIDEYCNCYWDDTQAFYWCSEVCDPVQEDLVVVRVGGQNVALSNFILPSWTDPQFVKGKVDYKGTLSTPFTLSVGGYAVKIPYGSTQPETVYGKNFPEWKKARKDQKYTRFGKRVQKGKK